jgi:hypothetical protein
MHIRKIYTIVHMIVPLFVPLHVIHALYVVLPSFCAIKLLLMPKSKPMLLYIYMHR